MCVMLRKKIFPVWSAVGLCLPLDLNNLVPWMVGIRSLHTVSETSCQRNALSAKSPVIRITWPTKRSKVKDAEMLKSFLALTPPHIVRFASSKAPNCSSTILLLPCCMLIVEAWMVKVQVCGVKTWKLFFGSNSAAYCPIYLKCR